MGLDGESVGGVEMVVRAAAQAVGNALGDSVGGGPAGAALGQALSDVGVRGIKFLRGRSAGRAKWTLDNTADQIRERASSGEEVRWDGDDADAVLELVESMIEAAARSAEERKCAVIANLMTSIAFNPSVSAADGLLYLQRIRDASWRQLVILEYFSESDRQAEIQSLAVEIEEGDAKLKSAVQVEMSEAAGSIELIGYVQEDGEVSNPLRTWSGGPPVAIEKLGPTALGETVRSMGRLEEVVSREDLDRLSGELVVRGKSTLACRAT